MRMSCACARAAGWYIHACARARACAHAAGLVAADAEDECVRPRAGTSAALEEAVVEVILLGPAVARPPLVHHLAAEEIGEARASDGALAEGVVPERGIAIVASAGTAEKRGEACEGRACLPVSVRWVVGRRQAEGPRACAPSKRLRIWLSPTKWSHGQRVRMQWRASPSGTASKAQDAHHSSTQPATALRTQRPRARPSTQG